MRNIQSILFILFPLHWRGAWIYFTLFLTSLNNKYTTLWNIGYTCPFCTNRADARAGRKNLEAPLPWHWSPFLCPYGNFRFNHRKGKDKEFLKTSLKACDGHFHMQTHTRAVCTMSIASSHILPIMDPQRRLLAGPQVPSGGTGGQSPRPPATCPALARKGGHCCSLTQWKVTSSCWSHPRAGNTRLVTLDQFQHPEKWRQYTADTTKQYGFNNSGRLGTEGSWVTNVSPNVRPS